MPNFSKHCFGDPQGELQVETLQQTVHEVQDVHVHRGSVE